MRIISIDGEFTVCKVKNYKQVDFSKDYVFACKTEQENSLVCKTCDLLADTLAREDGWQAFRVAGTLDFSLVGILAKISKTLADAQIAMFAVSTFDTDYVLIKKEHFDRALSALEKVGFDVK